MASGEIRVAVIGCGSLGKAIAHGLHKQQDVAIKSIEVTVNSDDSLKATSEELEGRVTVRKGGNAEAARGADVVILACPPGVMSYILREEGMRGALQGKPLVSVLAGVTTNAMADALKGDDDSLHWIFRALPNLAIATCASATALEFPNPSIPKAATDLVDKIFESLGGVTYVPASSMDAATVMCGSTPAYVALFLDGMVDGAVAAGVPREKARSMAAQMLSSTAALLQSQSPSDLRETVCAMPGCTIQGNLILEEGCVRGTAARAVKTAIEAASKLG